MRVLITGAAGFVGRFLREHAEAQGAEVVAAPPREELDLRDPDAARMLVASSRPEAVFHLAAMASVAESWSRPDDTLRNNLDSTVALLEAIRTEAPQARVLLAGSGEVYGPPMRLPVDESHPFRPQNPYALSKAAADLLGGFYADAHGLALIRTRSFNHAGPGQTDLYVASAFARQIAEAEASGAESAEILTGELRAKRDFTDVRDVVRAYWLLVERADPGAYNVCSGKAIEVGSILAALRREAQIKIDYRTDPDRLRRHEVMEITGSREKLTQATGWEPEIPLERTLRDVLDWWRAEVGP